LGSLRDDHTAWLVADIRYLASINVDIYYKKNHRQEFTPRCLSLDDIMPPKMSPNPLQKFRLCAGTKVNCDFSEVRTVYDICCATSDHACAWSI